MKKFVTMMTFFAVVAFFSFSPTPRPHLSFSGKGVNIIESKIDNLIKELYSNSKIPGMTIAVSKDGRLIYNKGYGFSNYEKQEPMKPYHRSRIGSVSKIITTLGVMKLTEEYPDFSVNKKLYASSKGVFPELVSAYRRGVHRHQPIIDMAMDKDNRVYTWYVNQKVSIGKSSDLDKHERLRSFSLPPGKTTNDIIAIAISPNSNHVFTWYFDGTYSSGTHLDLDKYSRGCKFVVPSHNGKDGIPHILAIGMGKDGAQTQTYVWYDYGKMSVGKATNLGLYEPPKSYTVHQSKSRYDIRGMAVNNENRVFSWFADDKTEVISGSLRDLDRYRSPYEYSYPEVEIPSSSYKTPKDMEKAYKKMEVRHLLSHTSGLKKDGVSAKDMFNLPEVERGDFHAQSYFLSTQKLLSQPGTSYKYSNRGLGHCGGIIEKVSGMKYGDFIQKKIFDPLKINDIDPIDCARSEKYDAYSHKTRGGNIMTLAWKTKPYAGTKVSAAGGWMSSAKNLVRIMVATDKLNNHSDILKKSTIDLMEKRPFSVGHALGWGYNKLDKGGIKLSHSGLIEGGNAYIVKYKPGAISKEGINLGGINIAICINTGHNHTGKLRTLASDIAKVVGKTSIPNTYDLFKDRSGNYIGVWRANTNKHKMWVGARWSSFTQKRKDLAPKGYRLVDLDTYEENGRRLYNGVFQEGSGKHALYKYNNWNDLLKKWKELNREGLRLIDIETYRQGNNRYFIGIWREGNGKYGLYRYDNWNDFTQKWHSMNKNGQRLIDAETYKVGSKRWYVGVWKEGSGGNALYKFDNWAEFNSKFKVLSNQNKRLIDIETFHANGKQFYLGVWRSGTDDYAFWHKMDWNDFRVMDSELTKQEVYLIDFERL